METKNNANPLATKSLMDLREIAKALHIKNIIKYRKAELVREIERVASTEPAPAAVAAEKPKQGTGRKRGRPRRVPEQAAAPQTT
ncbi:MAG: Rho termination factor N-terminal domain-containing protein [Bacteroidales bacterium]|nr:Rho termination factor N-terminal domain-containing protein [Bacteroidales bacterium]